MTVSTIDGLINQHTEATIATRANKSDNVKPIRDTLSQDIFSKKGINKLEPVQSKRILPEQSVHRELLGTYEVYGWIAIQE